MTDRHGRESVVLAALTAFVALQSAATGNEAPGFEATPRHLIRAALGTTAGSPGYDSNADLNHDGAINVLDVALLGDVEGADRLPPPHAASTEQVIIEPQPLTVFAGRTGYIYFLIRSNTTPLLGYSLDVEFVPQVGATGTVTANIGQTLFLESQNLITGGPTPCAALDPVFSVIQDGGDGSVFVNAITDDLATCTAVDGVNDVLARVAFDASIDATGFFTIQLGPASVLSDANAFAVPFAFTPGQIDVLPPPIPAASEWGLLVMGICLLTLGTVLIRRRLVVGRTRHAGM